jgi:hypothetical protein
MQRARATAAVLLCLASLCRGQVSDKISRVIAEPPRPGAPLVIQADLFTVASIDHLQLAYRPFGQAEYRRLEMVMTGNSATVSVPATDLTSAVLEYYFIIVNRDSIPPETYPMENPVDHPFRLNLSMPAEQTDNDPVIILSPDPSERISGDDIVISFSLLRADTSVDRKATRVLVDGIDLSGSATVNGDLVMVRVPQGPAHGNGQHIVRVELLDRQGASVYQKSWDFQKGESGGTPTPATTTVSGPAEWKYGSSVQAESRNENIANVSTPYNRLTVAVHGTHADLTVTGRAYITNEEKDYRQPQNRFYLGAENSWLHLGVGDSYPIYPEYIMTGQRIRGFDGGLYLGSFNLQFSSGQIVRSIEGDTIRTFPQDSLTAEQSRDPGASYGVYDPVTQRWAKYRFGTFNRSLLVLHPSFGSRDGAHIGFTYLKGKDDMTSIEHGLRPEENVVFGTDMALPFDNHHVELTAEAGYSLTNKDITSGSFTDAQIDSTYHDQSDRDHVRQVRDIVERFITVNQYLVPLNMKNLPTLAYEGGVAVNYFNNSLNFSYIRRGSEFESFGQNFLQTDIKGYRLNDRLGLMHSQIVLSGGIERLQDNTTEIKPATTTTTTGSVGVSYYPRNDLPNMTFAYGHVSNENGLDATSPYAVQDVMNRFFAQLGRQFDLGARHNAMISFSTTNRDDESAANRDSRNTTASISNSTSFAIPLQTLIGISTTSTSFAASVPGTDSTIAYTTLTANAQYRLLEDRLQLGGTFSPTLGDIERILVDTRAQYFLTTSLSVIGQLGLYFNKNVTNDTIWSLILRADI